MKINLQKYSEYKDSGVEWLGEIPRGWTTKRIKHLFHEINERSFDGSEDLLSVSQYTGVTNKSEKLEDGGMLTNANTLEGYKKVWEGDLVSNIMLAWNGSLGFSPFNGITSPAYSIYRLKTKDINRYFHYLLRTELYKSEFKRNSSGVIESRLRLYTDDFFRIESILPPKEDQTAIANFLDRKTALIDQAVDIKQKQIELLKERRQILIHKAVTRGLNPNAKLKDSGVEWIGKIPEGWEVKKLRYLANCFPSNVDKHSKPNEREVRLCNYTDVYKNDYITNDLDLMIATASDEQINKFALKEGDIVITKDSETASDIAVPTYIQETLKNVVCGYHLAIIRTYQSSYSRYLYQALKTKLFNTQFEICSNGITRVGLGNSDLKNGYFLLPTQKEQIQIADFIEKESFKIATAISLKEQEIEKLKEYKATLINSAVTGKIKISNYAK